MIRAECRTADDRVVEFDATPWFEQTDAETIVLLARHRWRSPWVADALESQPGYAKLHGLLQYARDLAERESEEDPSWSSFECVVKDTDALAWLEKHRPDVAKRVASGSAQ